MSEIIIKTKQGEIIPAISPEAFQLAVESMDGLNEQLKELQVKADALPKTFQSPADYAMAASLVAQKKSIIKLGDSTMTPYDELVKKVKTFITGQYNLLEATGNAVIDTVKPGMIEWDEREKRAAEAEQARIRAEKEAKLKRENEERAQKAADAAEELKKKRIAEIRADFKAGKITLRESKQRLAAAGATEEAAQAQIALDKEEADKKAVEAANKTTVKPRTQAVAGVVRRTNYGATCNDEDLLMHRVVGEYIQNGGKFGPLREFVMANNQKIGEKAREIKDDKKMEELYPFVTATKEKTF